MNLLPPTTLQLRWFPASPLAPVLLGAGLASAFVAGVYLIPQRPRLPRDAPDTVRRRLLGVTLATAGCVAAMHVLCQPIPATGSVWAALGLSPDIISHVSAAGKTLALFALLFLGPIVQETLDRSWTQRHGPRSILFWRNFVAAPLCEEIVFRACLIPLLEPVWGRTATLWLSPLFFGLAHVHHAVWGDVSAMQALGMFGYTTLFGWLAGAVFQVTRSTPAVVLSHAFCNFVELPDVHGGMSHRKRWIVMPAYVVGLVGFVVLAWRALE